MLGNNRQCCYKFRLRQAKGGRVDCRWRRRSPKKQRPGEPTGARNVCLAASVMPEGHTADNPELETEAAAIPIIAQLRPLVFR